MKTIDLLFSKIFFALGLMCLVAVIAGADHQLFTAVLCFTFSGLLENEAKKLKL